MDRISCTPGGTESTTNHLLELAHALLLNASFPSLKQTQDERDPNATLRDLSLQLPSLLSRTAGLPRLAGSLLQLAGRLRSSSLHTTFYQMKKTERK